MSPSGRPLRKGPLLLGIWAAASLFSLPAAAQVPLDSVTPGGVTRASAVVDAVFVDRLLPQGMVGAGDWASYLMARLGIVPIPPDLKVRVTSDSTRVVISSRMDELPPEARAALGPFVAMFPPTTRIEGDITLLRPAREVVQFYLARVRVGGAPIPEGVVAAVMMDVGRQYPALSRSGRSLFVQVPLDAQVQFLPGWVRLVGPPPDSAARDSR